MDHALVAGVDHRDTGLLQTSRIHLSFITHWIELGSDDHGGWETTQVLCLQGRGVGSPAVLCTREVVVPAPYHIVARDKKALGIFLVRSGARLVVVGDGVKQELVHESGTASITRHQCDSSGEVPSAAITANGNACGVTVDGRGVVGDPLSGSIAIFKCCRKFVLWGQTIVNRNSYTLSRPGERTAHSIMSVDTARDPAATVKKDEHREWPRPFGCVDAYRDSSLRPWYRAVFSTGDWFRFAPQCGECQYCLAGIANGLGVERLRS